MKQPARLLIWQVCFQTDQWDNSTYPATSWSLEAIGVRKWQIPELRGGQTALSRSKVLDQHKLISSPITRGCNDSLHFLLPVFLLSCHSPPSTRVSTVSVWHGFIMSLTVILAWSFLHTHHLPPPHTPLQTPNSGSAKPVHLPPVRASSSWRKISDLKTASMAKFSF